MERVIAALKSAGVSERDIKTQDVLGRAGLRQRRQGNPERLRGAELGRRHPARPRQLERLVLDAASRAWANVQVYGPLLTRSNREAYEAKALESAFGNARKRAEARADAAGVQLGRVTSIVEGFNGGPGPMMDMQRAKAEPARVRRSSRVARRSRRA